MDESGKYQGWANYATWNVNLWIMNEEPLYRMMRVKRTVRDFTPGAAEAFCRGVFPGGTPDMCDLDKTVEMDRVDWAEIADSFNE